ncbi:hypothetical protein JKA74_17780 [Marivirga sp. S37H4]|uniref:Uncharacterized protein n=1 Tax=Marivirga aurantiaca TaxID=2802615 RepID=A0A934X0W5_9BACT|nr:hypothetical protein [Marivirga aurantiaca]MBK6266898.1 hypothetical protein [Marivirga aurantiaca]
MASAKKKSTGSKILKVTGIISAVIFGLILIVTILFLTVLEPYTERLLKKQVTQNTKGLYELDFEDLDINLLSTTIRLNNIKLTYDSTKHQKLKAKSEAGSFLLDVKTDELEVSGINVLDYLIRSRINIHSILIDQPEVKMIHDTGVIQKKKKQDISETINSIGIDNFDLQDAQISYHKYEKKEEAVHKIPQLNVKVSDFIADSFDKEDIREMIDMDDLFISLKNQSFTTSNNVYNLKFDLFSYSIAEQQLKLEAFSAIGDHKEMAGPMIAPEIQVPLLKMDGLELMEALKTKKLHLDELLIDSTFVKLYEIPDLDITVTDVYRALAQLFEVTEIDNLNINRSKVSMYSRENKDVLIQKIEHVDLLLEEVSFDSLSVFDPRNNLALQQLTLKVEDYILQPEESPYTFTLAQLDMNTKKDHLKLRDLKLSSDITKNKQLRYSSGKASAQLVDFTIPEIQFGGIDMIRAFKHSNLDINKIAILNPTASIAKAFEQKSSGNEFSPEDIYNSFSFFVKEINIQEFLISNAELSQYPTEYKVHKLHHIEQARLSLSGIHFDSAIAYHNKTYAPIEEIFLGLNHYSYTTPGNAKSFQMGPLSYSSNQENLEINNIQYESRPELPINKADSLIISAGHFSISNFNIVEAFNKGSLQMGEILLQSPDIYVSRGIKPKQTNSEESQSSETIPGEEIFQWINPISVESIRIVDGTADYIERLADVTNFQNLQGFLVEVNQLKLTPENIKNTENIIPVDNIIVKAKNYTFHSPDSIYTVTLDSLFYASDEGNLKANHFQLRPDYKLHEYRVENEIDNSHRNLFEISSDQFSIKKFDLINAYNTGLYTFGEVLLTAPDVSILQNKQVVNYQQKMDSIGQQSNEKQQSKDSENLKQDNTEEKIDEDIQKQIDEYVSIFKIDSLRIEEGKFLLEILKNDSVRESQELEHLSLLVENLQLSDLEAHDLTDIFSVDDIDLLLKDYNFITPDSLYELRVDQLKASVKGQFIHIDSINYQPLFLIDEYTDKLDYAEDRFDVKIGSIEVEGINFDELFNRQHFIMEKILVDGLNGSIYRDSRVEQDPNRYPPTIQQFIKDFPVPLQLDTLALEDGVIVYSEISKDGTGPGVTTLADTRFQIFNITNDSLIYTMKDTLKVTASTSFLDESRLEIAFDFHMNHPEDLYTYEGYLEQMKFEAFNPLFTHLLFVKMESGVIEKIDFSVTATKHKSKGMMSFPYRNLRFRLLNKEDPGHPGFLLKVANWSLNHLLVKSNNPGNLFNIYREGKISVERNYSKSVFNHMGNSLLSGLISSTIPEPIETIFGVIGLP